MDPNFAVLLGDSTPKGECERMEDNESSSFEGTKKSNLIVIIVPAVGGAVILATVIALAPKYVLFQLILILKLSIVTKK